MPLRFHSNHGLTDGSLEVRPELEKVTVPRSSPCSKLLTRALRAKPRVGTTLSKEPRASSIRFIHLRDGRFRGRYPARRTRSDLCHPPVADCRDQRIGMCAALEVLVPTSIGAETASIVGTASPAGVDARAREIETVVPFEQVFISTRASSCWANALINAVPSPDFLVSRAASDIPWPLSEIESFQSAPSTS